MSNSIKASKESTEQFASRKQDHIRLAMKPENQATGAGFEKITLIHEALPEFNFDEIDITIKSLGKLKQKPFLVSSMTAGHRDAVNINSNLAAACAECGWAMGVGSQRRQLQDKTAAQEWRQIRKQIPEVTLFGNLGIAQLITTPIDEIQRLCDSLQAQGLFIHLNPLQECIQPEGTPNFAGSYKAIEKLCSALSIPVIIKETGCGFSEKTLKRLDSTGIAAVDLSGFGGTHWGRIEGDRAENIQQQQAAQTFKDWGISSVDAMVNALYVKPSYEIWASGGVRSGLDAAKLLAMGAKRIGFAKPMLEAALKDVDSIITLMQQMEFELAIALFCTGQKSLELFQENQIWRMQT